MKVRIKFSKQGPVKFIGHLDIMRYFQKAIRRANINIQYSEGFSPHQIMSFAMPLGVGLTSNGEYMDIEVEEATDCNVLIKQLNEVMVDGICIINCYKLQDNAKNAMAMVAAADYTLEFRPNKRPDDINAFLNGLDCFWKQDEIMMEKKTKSGSKIVDLKPAIYEISLNGEKIFMKVASGSANNLKPELVMDAYYQSIGLTCPEFAFQIQREEVYGNAGDEEHVELLPLGLIGEVVE